MKKIKILSFFAFIINLALLCAPFYLLGQLFIKLGFETSELKDFISVLFTDVSVVAVLLLAFISLISLPFNIWSMASGEFKTPKVISVFKFIFVTFAFGVFAVKTYYAIKYSMLSFDIATLVIAYICPLTAVLSYILFESGKRIGWGFIFTSISVGIAFMALTIDFVKTGAYKILGIDILYTTDIAWYIENGIYSLLSVVLAFVVWAISTILGKKLFAVKVIANEEKVAENESVVSVSDTVNTENAPQEEKIEENSEPIKEEVEEIKENEVVEQPNTTIKDEEVVEEESEKVEKKEPKKVQPVLYKDKSRVYHISRNENGKWQVKLANGEKAIKLFDTQLQAINYAKALVKTRGGSIRIHSVKGKIRK